MRRLFCVLAALVTVSVALELAPSEVSASGARAIFSNVGYSFTSPPVCQISCTGSYPPTTTTYPDYIEDCCWDCAVICNAACQVTGVGGSASCSL